MIMFYKPNKPQRNQSFLKQSNVETLIRSSNSNRMDKVVISHKISQRIELPRNLMQRDGIKQSPIISLVP